jgi:hypothetical protein
MKTKQLMYNVTLRRVRATIIAVQSNKHCKLSVCVFSLLSSMQCERTILSSVTCPPLKYFCTISHNRHDFGKKVTETKMCVLVFSSILSEIFLIRRRTEWCVIVNVHRYSCKAPEILWDIHWTWIFSIDFRKAI